MEDIELPDPKYIYHPGLESGEDDLFLFAESGDVACPTCERLYTADQLRAAILADREKGAQAAQGVVGEIRPLMGAPFGEAVMFEPLPIGTKLYAATEASKPVQAEAPPPNTTMKRDEWGALSPEAQQVMRDAVRARTLRAAQGAASIRDVPLLGSEAQGDKFPFSAWETMEHAKRALNAMLTHMGMDEDEWNKPTFEQAKSAVRTLEWQLGRPDQVALWKTRYESIKAPLSKFHQQAVDAGFDGIGDAIAVARIAAKEQK